MNLRFKEKYNFLSRKNLYKISFVLFTLFSFIIGYKLIVNLNEEFEKKAVEKLLMEEELLAKQTTNGIAAFFYLYKNILDDLAHRKEIINFNKEGIEALKRFINQQSNFIKAVTRIDSRGVVEYTFPYNKNFIGRDVSYQDHNAKLIKEQIPVISDVFKTIQGYYAIAYAHPIFEDGEFKGCISILIPFDVIANKFLKDLKFGNSGQTFMITANGNEIYCTNKEHIGKSVFETTKEQPDAIELLEEMMNGKAGYKVFNLNVNNTQDADAIKKIGYYMPIMLENTFWSIIIYTSLTEATNVVQSFKDRLFLVISILVLSYLFLALVFFVSYRKVGAAIKKSEETYKIVAEQTGQIIYEIFLDSKKIVWSGAFQKVIGFEKNEFDKFDFNNWLELIHPKDKELFKENYVNILNHKNDYSINYRIKTIDGKYVFVEDNGLIIRGGNNNPSRILGAIKDISVQKEYENELLNHKEELERMVAMRTRELNMINEELKIDIKRRKKTERALLEAKEQAEKSDNLKSEFLAQISHEIRTPINTILNFSSLIKFECEEFMSEDSKGSFVSIENAAQRLLRTIDLVLNMAEIETGSYIVSFEEVELYQEILEPLFHEFKILAQNKGIDIKIINNTVEKYNLNVDRYTVAKIFENIIDNSIKYTQKGKIDIVMHNTDKNILIDIIDTGIGISEEYLPKLFEKFSQEEQGYSRSFEGNGLGLALVKEYSRLNNAVVKVESRKGFGTKFSIAFSKNGK